MRETEKELQPEMNEMEDHTPPPEDPSQVLSPRRRSALVTYLAVLFCVAFLFVAVTLALEAKRLKLSNDSSMQANASLYNSISALQEENHSLQTELKTLESEKESFGGRLEEMELAAAAAEAERQTLQEKLSDLEKEKKTLTTEKNDLQAQLDELTQKVTDAVTVSELLQKAISLNEKGDLSGLADVLKEIEPLKELLSQTEQEIYEALVMD